GSRCGTHRRRLEGERDASMFSRAGERRRGGKRHGLRCTPPPRRKWHGSATTAVNGSTTADPIMPPPI
ncbi:hypothetical protein HAX54_002399, partial [Datura stramonium]|nr:hypothetical protein [Datura stramonium]